MAAIEEALPSWLLSQSAVSALIDSRMYPEVLPQPRTSGSLLPAVTFEIISTTEAHRISQRSGFVWTRFQFVCYGNTRKSSNAVARAIRNSGVDQLKGLVSSVDIRGVKIESGFRTDRELIGDGDQMTGSQQFRFLNEFDLMVSHLE